MTAPKQIHRSSDQGKLLDYSVFVYCYRDASNYKSWGQVLLQGHASSADDEELRKAFDAGEFFIAEQLDIPPLYGELWALSGGPTADDHVWHTFHELRLAVPVETGTCVFSTVANWVSKVKAIDSWYETLSPHWNL